MTKHYLSTGDIAKKLGTNQNAVSNYKFPEPDVIVGGRYKGWEESKIDDWIANRPGQGARTDLKKSNTTT